nr:DUF2837 family protein [Paraburkholderia solitsugae]
MHPRSARRPSSTEPSKGGERAIKKPPFRNGGISISAVSGAAQCSEHSRISSRPSSVSNGPLPSVDHSERVATQVSVEADDVIEGQTSDSSFRRAIITLAGARVLGTLCAQIMLIPAALIIVRVAELI